MFFTIEPRSQSLTVIRGSSGPLRTRAVWSLDAAFADCVAQRQGAVAIDLSNVTGCAWAGLAALVEIYTRYTGRLRMGFCGLDAKTLQALTKAGLDGVLPLYPSLEAALATPDFRRHALSGMTAVVLSAGRGRRLGPLGTETPKPMLDVLGKPVLSRILENVSRYGVDGVFVNTAHKADNIQSHFRRSNAPEPTLFFSREGRRDADGAWAAEPLGTAGALARLARDNAAFSGDVLVTVGDVLSNIDLSAMLSDHRRSGAAATIAVADADAETAARHHRVELDPCGRVRRVHRRGAHDGGSMINSGIYLFRADVLNGLEDRPGLDIVSDVLDRLLARGAGIHGYRGTFDWATIDCVRDYADVLFRGLNGRTPFLAPAAREIRPGVWLAPGATVSPRAEIRGTCYVGRDAVIGDDALILGSVVVGDGSIVEGRTVVQDSVLRQGLRVRPGAIVQGMVVGADWAVAHEIALDTPETCPPLDGIEPIDGDAGHADDGITADPVLRIAL